MNAVAFFDIVVDLVDDSVGGVILTMMLPLLVGMKLISFRGPSFSIIVLFAFVRAECLCDIIIRNDFFDSVLKKLDKLGTQMNNAICASLLGKSLVYTSAARCFTVTLIIGVHRCKQSSLLQVLVYNKRIYPDSTSISPVFVGGSYLPISVVTSPSA